MTRIGRGVLVASLLLLPTVLSGQDGVTATSGDPRVIDQIQRRYQETESSLSRMRVDTLDFDGNSREGGAMVAYWNNQEIRKLVAWHYGMMGSTREEFYFDSGQLYLALVVDHTYAEKPDSGVVRTLEHRLYVSDGRLIRKVRTQQPPPRVHDTDEGSAYFPGVRRRAATYLECAPSNTCETR